ncbi:MAG: hypothetical protein ABL934_03820 [Lysobacteraceae bacterium]
MSADPDATQKNLPRMIVRGALALELVPGSQPGRAALRQAEAGTLAGLVGRDLATLAAEAATLDLVFAGAHYDPAEMLRPGWPLHRRLEELHARAPQSTGPRIIAFGADEHGAVPQPLRAELELHGGPLRVVPFLLVGTAEQATAVAADFEHALLERGMAQADTALTAQDAFEAKVEHARYLTAYDLAAMMALQYRHVGLGALWPLVETALLAPNEDAWLDAPPEPLLRYIDGAVRFADFDRSSWQRHYAGDELNAARIDRGFMHFQARQRQFAAILKVHGIDVRMVPCPAQRDARAVLG